MKGKKDRTQISTPESCLVPMNNMIIIKTKEKCNTKIRYSIKKFQEYYNNLINSLSLKDIECPNCHSNEWVYHARYSRRVDIFNRLHKLTITRIKCKVCGETHAILIEDIIPYSIVSYEIIVNVCLKVDSIGFSNDYFIRHKFIDKNSEFMPDYKSFCSKCCRKKYLGFYAN